jgi:hypothetical protein
LRGGRSGRVPEIVRERTLLREQQRDHEADTPEAG